jgi:hypothetical protein
MNFIILHINTEQRVVNCIFEHVHIFEDLKQKGRIKYKFINSFWNRDIYLICIHKL